MSHSAEPFVEIHAADAARFGLRDRGLTVISSPRGEAVVRVAVTAGQKQGSVFMPIHWTARYASQGVVGALIRGCTDPASGQPELKFTPVLAARYPAAWHGFAVSVRPPIRTAPDYWALARTKGGFRLECAGLTPAADWMAFARAMLAIDEAADVLAYHDAGTGHYRFAAFEAERLTATLFIGRDPITVSRSWICGHLGREMRESRDRLQLLAGRPAAPGEDLGVIVCACFGVGAKQIAGAVRIGRCRSLEQIGEALRAGTNCGSCRPEILKIINTQRAFGAG